MRLLTALPAALLMMAAATLALAGETPEPLTCPATLTPAGAAGQGIGVQLELPRAVLEQILRADGLIRQPAGLSGHTSSEFFLG